MPKVTVILTSYNHAKYLPEAVDSALSQTFDDFEFIIWDDASTDESWSLIKGYSDPRIKAYRNDQRRRGIYGLNKVIAQLASSNYIAIHHSDDIWEKQKLEKQIKFLDGHSDFGAVFTNALAIGEDGDPLNDPNHFYSNIFEQPNRTRHQWLRYFFYHGNALCHPSVIVRKKCFEKCGLYRFGMAQLTDFDMWIRLCLKYEIYVLPEKLVRFRVRANEANASAIRPATRIRYATEFYLISKIFLKIETFEEMLQVFPEVEKYYRPDGFEPKFVLAMVALSSDTFQSTKLFGIELLLDLIRDIERAPKIKSLYGFDYHDLVRLTAIHDVFSVEALAQRDGQIQSLNQAVAALNKHHDAQIQSLNQAVAALTVEREAILNSRTWRFTAPLRWLVIGVKKLKQSLLALGERQ